MSSTINIQNIVHKYKQKTALNNISLCVLKGQLHGLIGPDSAGKTTLMRILCGLLPIQQGEGSIFELSLTASFKEIRARLGYMPQRFSLYQDLSVEENLMFFARLFSVPVSDRDKRLPELYGFSRLEPFKTRRAGALSGGMKQKLALSCALIHRPELLILDEPTYGVDPVSRQEFWQMLKAIQKEGTTILVSTPYMDEAELCDHVTLMLNGNLLVSDAPEQIIKNWSKQVFRIKADNLKQLENSIAGIPDLESCQLFGNELHLVVSAIKADNVLSVLQDNYRQSGITIESIQPTMEDIYLSFMHRAGK